MKHKIMVAIIVVESFLCIIFTCIFLFNSLTPPDDLNFAIERIEGITGYSIDIEDAELILHKSNASDSIVFIRDWNLMINGYINDQNLDFMEKDVRWSKTNIPENEVFSVVHDYVIGSSATRLHFRPVCYIDGGEYDWMFYDGEPYHDSHFCIIDIETGIIALYIFLY